MKNSELLAYTGPADLLIGLDRQRQFVLRIESAKQPCPNCGHAIELVLAVTERHALGRRRR